MSRQYKMSPDDMFGISVGLGQVQGVDPFSSFGVSSEMTADVKTDLSGALGVVSIPLPPFAGVEVELVSAGADTTEVTIYGLGPECSTKPPVVVNLTGTTPVPIGIFSRINAIVVTGTIGIANTIQVRSVGGGIVYSAADVNAQQSHVSMYSVPAGHSLMLRVLIGTMQKSSGAETDVLLRVNVKEAAQDYWGVAFGFGLQRQGDSSIQFDNIFPQPIKGPADIKIDALPSATGAIAAAWFSGVLIQG